MYDDISPSMMRVVGFLALFLIPVCIWFILIRAILRAALTVLTGQPHVGKNGSLWSK